MKKAIASAGLLALGAMGVQTAQAQMTASADKSWSVAGTLRGFYDDNYNTQPSGPEKRSTFGFEISPSAGVNFALSQTTINASYIYDLRYYDDRAGHKDDQSHDFELGITHNFSPRYSADFADSFVIAQEPEVLDPVTLSEPLRSDGNNLRNTMAMHFHGTLTPLFGFAVGYGNTLYDYDENAGNTATPGEPSRSALLDRVEHVVSLDSRWTLSPQTVFIFGYQFGAVVYTSDESVDSPTGFPVNGPVALNPFYVASDTRNNISHSIYVGVEQQFRKNFNANARVGVELLDYYNAPAGNSSSSVSPYVNLGLAYQYNAGGSVSLSFQHSHNQTDQAASVADPGQVTLDQESSSVYLSLSQQITPVSPDLVASLTAQYQNSVFNGGPANSLTDNIYLLGLNLTYKFNRYFSAETGYNYDLLSSDISGRGYSRNRVYIGVTASY